METQRNNSSTKRLEITTIEENDKGNKLVQKHYGLIVSVAAKYKEQFPYISYEIGDLINEGVLVLLSKYKKYDKKKGKFSTYFTKSFKHHFAGITRKERSNMLEFVESSEQYENGINIATDQNFLPRFLNLSKKAKDFVQIALEAPAEFCAFMNEKSKHTPYQYLVKMYLKISKNELIKIRKELLDQLIDS